MLTGSASKGRKLYYYYYHCSSSCGIRYTAQVVNDFIVDEIKKYVRPLPKLQLYKEVIASTFKTKTRLQRDEIKQLNVQLEEANKRISKARELLLDGGIDAGDYRSIKLQSEEQINRLEAKLTASITETTDIDSLLSKAINNISKIDILYANGSITQKRKIIGSMFPEKLIFDEFQHRTNRINEAIKLMCLIDNKLESKKKWDKSICFRLVPRGDPAGTRTQDPYIKSVLLYQLSYRIFK